MSKSSADHTLMDPCRKRIGRIHRENGVNRPGTITGSGSCGIVGREEGSEGGREKVSRKT